MHECLDIKAESWTHTCDVLVVEFFQYGSLSSVIKAAALHFICTRTFHTEDNLQKQKPHFLLL